eukprot:1876817-Rhodomonas_salina.2
MAGTARVNGIRPPMVNAVSPSACSSNSWSYVLDSWHITNARAKSAPGSVGAAGSLQCRTVQSLRLCCLLRLARTGPGSQRLRSILGLAPWLHGPSHRTLGSSRRPPAGWRDERRHDGRSGCTPTTRSSSCARRCSVDLLIQCA